MDSLDRTVKGDALTLSVQTFGGLVLSASLALTQPAHAASLASSSVTSGQLHFWFEVEREATASLSQVVELPASRSPLRGKTFQLESPEVPWDTTRLILTFAPSQARMARRIPTESGFDNPLVKFRLASRRVAPDRVIFTGQLLGVRPAPCMCDEGGDVEVGSPSEAAQRLTSGSGQRFGYLHSLGRRGQTWYASVHFARYYRGRAAIREAKRHGSNAPDCFYIRDDFEKSPRTVELVVAPDCPFVHQPLGPGGADHGLEWLPLQVLADALVATQSALSNPPGRWGSRSPTPFWFSVKHGKLTFIGSQFMP